MKLDKKCTDVLADLLNLTRYRYEQYCDECWDRKNPGVYTHTQIQEMEFRKETYNDLLNLVRKLGYVPFISENDIMMDGDIVLNHEILEKKFYEDTKKSGEFRMFGLHEVEEYKP